MSLQRLVLVLNASYEACNIVPARRALTLVLGGKAIVEEKSRYSIRTSKVIVPVPSVIRLISYRRIPRQNRSISRKGILLRDASTCQYCLRPFGPKDLTLDHVVPRSRGGGSTWENLVSSCFPCNNKKANKTPEEAGMVLAKQPRQITIHAKHRLLAGADDAAWDRYLFT